MMEERFAKICNAFGNEARLRLILAMKDCRIGTCCSKIGCDEEGISVADAVAFMGLAQSTVSQHLSVLEEAGILQREKRSQWTVFRLNHGLLQGFAEELGTALGGGPGRSDACL